MADLLELRPQVAAFAQLMERKLRSHDSGRGKRGWKIASHRWLYNRLRQELNELAYAIAKPPVDQSRAAMECVDVANFAMMIADVLGQLEGE